MLASLALIAAATPALDDTCATAVFGGPIDSTGSDLVQLELSAGEVSDHRRYFIQPDTVVTVQAQFQHAQGDVQLRLWNSDCSVLLDSSTGTGDLEEVRWSNRTLGPIQVVVEVYLDGALTAPVPYALSLVGGYASCTAPDVFEPNQTCATATPIPAFGNFSVSPTDEDWFTIDVLPTTTLFVRPGSGASPDVVIELWEANCGGLIDATPGLGGFVRAENGSSSSITVAVRVRHADPAGECIGYSLDVGTVTGIIECPSPINSFGLDSVLECMGSASLSFGDPAFQVQPVPLGAPSLLFFGPDAAAIPLGAGSLCVDPAGLRRGPSGQQIGGQTFCILDRSSPAPGAPPLLAGQTYRFQAWFRDAGHPTGFALTNSLRISFAP